MAVHVHIVHVHVSVCVQYYRLIVRHIIVSFNCLRVIWSIPEGPQTSLHLGLAERESVCSHIYFSSLNRSLFSWGSLRTSEADARAPWLEQMVEDLEGM